MNFSKRLYALAASGNPLAQVLMLLVAGVVLIGSVVMGAVILAALFGLAVVGAVAFSLRLWWINRKLERRQGAEQRVRASHGRLIETEYTVVTEREVRRRPRE